MPPPHLGHFFNLPDNWQLHAERDLNAAVSNQIVYSRGYWQQGLNNGSLHINKPNLTTNILMNT